ncbi:N-acetylmuramoyl-L-alanine amidase [Candidatus Contubernalis alkaliaceticus]|uniref:N-acetylmuramoyl-L-alanine amidase n=1 Tax=Candidatus Contubernalis alkaliaceticus TaxID=338645 RepID=UPI001F4C0C9E|nr:N-acetylmuramoyl-L-alanine amidase [Candidatus Contubernalis alkalaceticus]UNC90974.1 N-acetylmuramoyl-L-alanine amidase [Candidatus Contubernalis alkalaceticus]
MKIVYFFSPKKRSKKLAIILLFILMIGSSMVWNFAKKNIESAVTFLPLQGRTIVVDPGHGGYDPGVGRNDFAEKDVNLAISLVLRDYLQQGGARVVMTREIDMDFLQAAAGPKKKLDMKNRLVIIEESKADLIISIHSNAISSSYWSGAQTFYQEGDEEGKALAELIQKEMIRVLQNTDRMIKPGDYVLLRESSMPGVVIELGFLSNPTEARLLMDPEYQIKLAWSIYGGLVNYFESD